MEDINSMAFFKQHWLCWRILGIVKQGIRFPVPYLLYSTKHLNILVTLCYPLHLSLALFSSETQADNIKNLAVSVICIACGTKFIIYSTKLHKVREAEVVLRELDARIQNADERSYFKTIRRNMQIISLVFVCIYLPIGVIAELSFILRVVRSLLYPAWFPFNWHEFTYKFYIANIYQIVGISYCLLQNYVDDCFPPIAFCLLADHIKLLGMRVSKIGYNNCDMRENERELTRCIVDQRNLYKLFNIIQEIISLPMLLQFAVTAFNICLALAALLFYVDETLDRLYYFVYFLAMPLEVFPTCYYASHIQILFQQLQYEIFSSNWVYQSRYFTKHMVLFSERSAKECIAIAGGMVPIHLNTFFATCKGAYSLFAVVMKMKN